MGESTTPGLKQRVGDFEIVREIGRGGMGVVYEARQVSLNRKVALKVLSSQIGLSSKAVLRFRREAEAAAKLHHTNIVPIYATGEEDGTHYYAMELIEGPSLNQVIQQMRAPTIGRQHTATPQVWLDQTMTADGERSQDSSAVAGSSVAEGSSSLLSGGGYFDAVARMIAEVADALDYAHNQGVIHRDIKPSNLLLSPAGRLSINDFGLARMLEQPGMTMTGEFVGSPLYMSPEQITAGRAPLDHRTDIYSLGATLYELLTLQPPFPGERRDQIIAQIIGKEPKPPRRVNRKVPVDLETICLKSMEKDPDRRYQSAGQMAEDLRRYVNRFAISAKRAGPVGRTIKWVRRRPAVAALLGLVVLLGAGAGTLAYGVHCSNVRMLGLRRQQAIDDAMLAAMSGRLETARAAIEQAELLGAPTGRIRMLYGLVAIHEGQPQDAVQQLEQAVRLMPDSVAASSLLAQACDQANHLERYYQLVAKIDTLTAATPEDFLFKGLLEVQSGFAEGLGLLDEAIRRRDSAVARLVRAEARRWRATDTADVKDVEAALEDAIIAKGMLHGNPVALREHLIAHLVAAKVYAAGGEEDRVRASLAEAREDVESLGRFAGSAVAHEARARYFEHTGQADAALAEWRKAVACPGSSNVMAVRCAAALCGRGAFEEAIQVLDRFGDWGENSACRSSRLFILPGLPDGEALAMAAYREMAMARPVGMYALDPEFVLRLLGQRQEAVAACRGARERFLAGSSPRMLEWYKYYGDYLCGNVSTEQLLAAAGPSRWKQCEAHFLIGLDCLADGDRAAATEHFQRSVDTLGFEYFEYVWSRAFLTRLKQDPTWPPWIPLRDAASRPATEATDPGSSVETGQP
jgi:tetratricopeptide (TPR) repeat protein